MSALDVGRPPVDHRGFVTTHDDVPVAVGHSVDPDRWRAGLEEVLGRIAGRFARVESRRRAESFLSGLLAGLPRVTC